MKSEREECPREEVVDMVGTFELPVSVPQTDGSNKISRRQSRHK